MPPVTFALPLLLLATVAAATASTPVPPWLQVYSGQHQTGSNTTFYDSQSTLGDWDDAIRSICLDGFWVFFENEQYNAQAGGLFWALGLRGCLTLDSDFDQQVSSIRRVGNGEDASADSLTLYKDTYFSGEQLFTETDMASTTSESGYQSVIVSGPDSWTIYSGENYTGQSVCLYSDSDSMWINDQKIQYGLYYASYYLGDVGSDIRSVRKGCLSSARRHGQPLSGAGGRPVSADKGTANSVAAGAGAN